MIKLESHNPSWSKKFQLEAQSLKNILGNNCLELHHIGSTSIPKIYAKPIIDILIVVNDLAKVDLCNINMTKLGYIVKGEYGFFMRRFFIKENAFHVHIFEKGNSEIDRHLKFRDWMRTHTRDRLAYESLKKNLAKKYQNDITAYSIAKTDFVTHIEEKAGWDGIKICKAFTELEWDKVAQYHSKYDLNIEYKSLKNDSSNTHFLLFKRELIIGYAYLQMRNGKISINILEVDKKYQYSSVEEYFRASIQRWLNLKELKD
ncbi:GrpB family protein [Francisella sp. 19X1-34]|uniref:GrpB family protein n=1 Tax=Francisella sp. 19X1-34 TaxID=3087177 RepID=UPI002E32BF64|nr:GrpB family protein [Francisella sp. 19X1-34]MED7788540.1 GrpB family protein [Francisella sp. 19X1-34]